MKPPYNFQKKQGVFPSAETAGVCLQQQIWTFAKSMPKDPHEYAVRSKFRPEIMSFDEVWYLINHYGVLGVWKESMTYRYFLSGGYLYWTMHWDVSKARIINRCKPECANVRWI